MDYSRKQSGKDDLLNYIPENINLYFKTNKLSHVRFSDLENLVNYLGISHIVPSEEDKENLFQFLQETQRGLSRDGSYGVLNEISLEALLYAFEQIISGSEYAYLKEKTISGSPENEVVEVITVEMLEQSKSLLLFLNENNLEVEGIKTEFTLSDIALILDKYRIKFSITCYDFLVVYEKLMGTREFESISEASKAELIQMINNYIDTILNQKGELSRSSSIYSSKSNIYKKPSELLNSISRINSYGEVGQFLLGLFDDFEESLKWICIEAERSINDEKLILEMIHFMEFTMDQQMDYDIIKLKTCNFSEYEDRTTILESLDSNLKTVLGKTSDLKEFINSLARRTRGILKEQRKVNQITFSIEKECGNLITRVSSYDYLANHVNKKENQEVKIQELWNIQQELSDQVTENSNLKESIKNLSFKNEIYQGEINRKSAIISDLQHKGELENSQNEATIRSLNNQVEILDSDKRQLLNEIEKLNLLIEDMKTKHESEYKLMQERDRRLANRTGDLQRSDRKPKGTTIYEKVPDPKKFSVDTVTNDEENLNLPEKTNIISESGQQQQPIHDGTELKKLLTSQSSIQESMLEAQDGLRFTCINLDKSSSVILEDSQEDQRSLLNSQYNLLKSQYNTLEIKLNQSIISAETKAEEIRLLNKQREELNEIISQLKKEIHVLKSVNESIKEQQLKQNQDLEMMKLAQKQDIQNDYYLVNSPKQKTFIKNKEKTKEDSLKLIKSATTVRGSQEIESEMKNTNTIVTNEKFIVNFKSKLKKHGISRNTTGQALQNSIILVEHPLVSNIPSNNEVIPIFEASGNLKFKGSIDESLMSKKDQVFTKDVSDKLAKTYAKATAKSETQEVSSKNSQFDFLHFMKNTFICKFLTACEENLSKVYTSYIHTYNCKSQLISQKVMITQKSIYVMNHHDNFIINKFSVKEILQISISTKNQNLIVFHFKKGMDDMIFEDIHRADLINFLKRIFITNEGDKLRKNSGYKVKSRTNSFNDRNQLIKKGKVIIVNFLPQLKAKLNGSISFVETPPSFGFFNLTNFENCRKFGYLQQRVDLIFGNEYQERFACLSDLGLIIFKGEKKVVSDFISLENCVVEILFSQVSKEIFKKGVIRSTNIEETKTDNSDFCFMRDYVDDSNQDHITFEIRNQRNGRLYFRAPNRSDAEDWVNILKKFIFESSKKLRFDIKEFIAI